MDMGDFGSWMGLVRLCLLSECLFHNQCSRSIPGLSVFSPGRAHYSVWSHDCTVKNYKKSEFSLVGRFLYGSLQSDNPSTHNNVFGRHAPSCRIFWPHARPNPACYFRLTYHVYRLGTMATASSSAGDGLHQRQYKLGDG